MSDTIPQSASADCRKYIEGRIDFNTFNTFDNVRNCGKCCGGCEHFLHEDVQGFGICEETVGVCRCSDNCHLEPPTERQVEYVVEYEEKTSLWERLKICWHALTKRYYIFLSASEDTVIFDKDGNYVGLKSGSLAAYSYTGSKKDFITKDGYKVGMREIMWGATEKLKSMILGE